MVRPLVVPLEALTFNGALVPMSHRIAHSMRKPLTVRLSVSSRRIAAYIATGH